MLPQVTIGSITINMYVLMMVVGALSNIIYTLSIRKKTQLTGWQSVLIAPCITLTFFVGIYAISPLGGRSIFGAFFVTPLVTPILKKLFRLPKPMIHDILAISMLIAVVSIKIGCFFAGCCEGIVLYIGSGYFQWPAQIIGSFLGILIMVWLLRIEASAKKQGALYPLFMIAYGMGRFFLDYLEYAPLYWGLRRCQWFGLALALIGSIWLIVYKKHSSK